jgi:adenine-specific DNA glycosylase
LICRPRNPMCVDCPIRNHCSTGSSSNESSVTTVTAPLSLRPGNSGAVG